MLITLEFPLVPAAPMAFKDFINATAVFFWVIYDCETHLLVT